MSDKYISRDNLELVIDGLKVGMTPDWNENDKSAVGYIENRPFYTDGDIVHQLDEKYIPDSVARVEDIVEDIKEAFGEIDALKMNAENPVGTGSFSMNRKAGTTVGSNSHAEGYNTTASGEYSHAEGYYTISASKYQHVHGMYNIADTASTYAHIVGNGTSADARSNAHTLDWKGVGWFQGGLQVGGNAQDDGAKNVMLNGDKEIIIASSTEGSTKQFKITIDDTGTLIVSEIVAGESE